MWHKELRLAMRRSGWDFNQAVVTGWKRKILCKSESGTSMSCILRRDLAHDAEPGAEQGEKMNVCRT